MRLYSSYGLLGDSAKQLQPVYMYMNAVVDVDNNLNCV